MRTGIPVFLILILISAAGCDKMQDKMLFCSSYNASQDFCENEGQSFKTGKVTVLIDLYSRIDADDVKLNITDVNTNKIVNSYEFSVSSVLKKVYFENIPFDYPSKYLVSVLKPDGTVIVSNEVNITN